MAAHHNHTSADVSHTAIPMTTTMQMQRNQTVARLHQRQEMSCIEPSTSIQLARTDSRKVSVWTRHNLKYVGSEWSTGRTQMYKTFHYNSQILLLFINQRSDQTYVCKEPQVESSKVY
jgi:hypothetical protein